MRVFEVFILSQCFSVLEFRSAGQPDHPIATPLSHTPEVLSTHIPDDTANTLAPNGIRKHRFFTHFHRFLNSIPNRLKTISLHTRKRDRAPKCRETVVRKDHRTTRPNDQPRTTKLRSSQPSESEVRPAMRTPAGNNLLPTVKLIEMRRDRRATDQPDEPPI